MKIVSIILARGGSKGIPKKNIININGKPLIQYSIEASQKSCVKNCWVSTDCSEIKQIAHSLGTNVLDRPKNLSTDTASSDDALVHFSKHVDFDILVFIQPTSPLFNENDLVSNDTYNFPNPFNPVTQVQYDISQYGQVIMRVYDLRGREVVQLINEHQNPGHYAISWNAENNASGMYFIEMLIRSGEHPVFHEVRKVLYLK